ncbi:hypothetical protein SNEBB_000938, partial [Seison nebaliae]
VNEKDKVIENESFGNKNKQERKEEINDDDVKCEKQKELSILEKSLNSEEYFLEKSEIISDDDNSQEENDDDNDIFEETIFVNKFSKIDQSKTDSNISTIQEDDDEIIFSDDDENENQITISEIEKKNSSLHMSASEEIFQVVFNEENVMMNHKKSNETNMCDLEWTLSVSNLNDSVEERNMTVMKDEDRTLSLEDDSIDVLNEAIRETLVNSSNGIKQKEESGTDEDVLEKSFCEIKENIPKLDLENEKIIPNQETFVVESNWNDSRKTRFIRKVTIEDSIKKNLGNGKKQEKISKVKKMETKIEKKVRREELIPQISQDEQENQEESKNATQMGKKRTTKKRTNKTTNLMTKVNLNKITEDKKLLRKEREERIKRNKEKMEEERLNNLRRKGLIPEKKTDRKKDNYQFENIETFFLNQPLSDSEDKPKDYITSIDIKRKKNHNIASWVENKNILAAGPQCLDEMKMYFEVYLSNLMPLPNEDLRKAFIVTYYKRPPRRSSFVWETNEKKRN